MDVIILVILAVIPPIGFLLYIHRLDSIEPEPHSLIIKAMILGAAAVIPAAILEPILAYLLRLSVELGMVPALAIEGLSGAAVTSFVVIAPIEEALKLGVVLLFIWKNPNFNEENDGIVYVGSSAIGFSLLENIIYVVQYGFGAGIMRSMTSIPLHTFTGVLMGFFVGMAKCAPEGRSRSARIAAGFIIAYIVHALYDTLALSGTAVGMLIVPLVIVLVIFGVIYLKKGVRLSSRRWNKTNIDEPSREMEEAGNTGSGRYKVIISRVIFLLCAIFWVVLAIGMIAASDRPAGTPLEVITGGVILTIIPITIGLVLELSYHRHKKNAAEA